MSNFFLKIGWNSVDQMKMEGTNAGCVLSGSNVGRRSGAVLPLYHDVVLKSGAIFRCCCGMVCKGVQCGGGGCNETLTFLPMSGRVNNSSSFKIESSFTAVLCVRQGPPSCIVWTWNYFQRDLSCSNRIRVCLVNALTFVHTRVPARKREKSLVSMAARHYGVGDKERHN